jgi:hypothetical protein
MFRIYKKALYPLNCELGHRYFYREKYYNVSCSIILPGKKIQSLITDSFSRVPAMYENYRRYQRYSISAKALITRRDIDSPETLTTQVTTISQGGMGFYAAVPLRKTTQVTIKLFFGRPGMEILEGKIASVCLEGNNYFVGIAFDRDIPYERFIEIFGLN